MSAASPTPRWGGEDRPEALPPRKGAEDLRLITGRGSEVAAAGVIPKQASLRTREEVRSSVRCLLSEGFSFRECMTIFRSHLVDVAIEQANKSFKLVCNRLHISRQILLRHRAAAKEFLR